MEALILRRNYPVPVTFADLRLAVYTVGVCPFGKLIRIREPIAEWHAALKEVTGAHDDIYVVQDGREHHVARINAPDDAHRYEWINVLGAALHGDAMDALVIAADEAGYWERPREIRVEFQGRAPTLKAIAAVAERSRKAVARG